MLEIIYIAVGFVVGAAAGAVFGYNEHDRQHNRMLCGDLDTDDFP